ncbi:hypothetical protein X759_35560 [Mesorhizobium sp. LSHC420B00]|uniref:hypothetical protein n=1 Tax=Mesorhizobium sp. LSHC420B00 TaxID=1287292 RepID=UPI0003CF567B|nr:hypothetical protein [Mesorhizobium sp. LSHC420B00]ESX61115.1 hypothetical protein X759_35560 [Mesorhizobium sp. LSHC420B00]
MAGIRGGSGGTGGCLAGAGCGSILQGLGFIAQRFDLFDHVGDVGRNGCGDGDGIGADGRLVGREFEHAVGIDRPDLGVNGRALLQGARRAGVGGTEPFACARRVDAVLRRVGLVLDQHAVADFGRHAIDGLQAMQEDVGRGCEAHGLAFAGQETNGGSCRSGHEGLLHKKSPA